ncbi:acyltransferase family protein [Micromonosporaceae bacterium Da 78-11]
MRNRYLDLLRAAAIVRVIVYHLFGWPWLSILLPAMGIMFALAGSLTAASLDKRAARSVVTSRLRRLLPPLWLLGLIAVPVMLIAGWAQESDGDHPFSLARLAFWILPLGDPPGSDRGIDVWEPLWYIRAYVWFVLLSPLLYRVYRRIGWFAVAGPIVLIAILDKVDLSLPDTADAALWDFVTYGACWIAGFAHHDGRLARLRPPAVLGAAVVLGGAALYWLSGHQGEDAWDLNDVSESQALWSVAFVLLALRWQPAMGWLARAKPLDKAVTLLNARAVTVYLWHNIAIALVWPVLTVLTLDDLGGLDGPVDLVAALLLTVGAVLAFGWAEDLAAKRRPRFWPTTDPAPRPGPGPNTGERVPALVGVASETPTPFATDGPAGPGGSGTAAALGGRANAVAAKNRMPASWPPAPRAGTDDEPADAEVAGSAARRSVGSGTRDLGLPVAGRRAEPMDGAAQGSEAAVSEAGDVDPADSSTEQDATGAGAAWDGEASGTWAATGPHLGGPGEFGWTTDPGEQATPASEQATPAGSSGPAGKTGAGEPGGRRAAAGPWPRRGGLGGGAQSGMPDWFRGRRGNSDPGDDRQ